MGRADGAAGGEFGDSGGEEGGGGGAGGGELGFQRVHPSHQFVHFRHDPALFGEGCEETCRVKHDGQNPDAIPAWGIAPGSRTMQAKG